MPQLFKLAEMRSWHSMTTSEDPEWSPGPTDPAGSAVIAGEPFPGSTPVVKFFVRGGIVLGRPSKSRSSGWNRWWPSLRDRRGRGGRARRPGGVRSQPQLRAAPSPPGRPGPRAAPHHGHAAPPAESGHWSECPRRPWPWPTGSQAARATPSTPPTQPPGEVDRSPWIARFTSTKTRRSKPTRNQHKNQRQWRLHRHATAVTRTIEPKPRSWRTVIPGQVCRAILRGTRFQSCHVHTNAHRKMTGMESCPTRSKQRTGNEEPGQFRL